MPTGSAPASGAAAPMAAPRVSSPLAEGDRAPWPAWCRPERLLLAAVLILPPLMFVAIHRIVAATEVRIVEAVGVKVAEAAARHVLGVKPADPASVYESLAAGGFDAADGAHGVGDTAARSQERHADPHAPRPGVGSYSYRWLAAGAAGATPFDAFQRQAWEELDARAARSPDGPEQWGAVWRFEESDGRRVVRYLRAAFARPGERPTVALEVVVPLDQVMAFAALQTRGTQYFLIGIGVFGLALLTLLCIHTIQTARRQRELATRYEQLAKIDALTGLPNRLAVEDAMRERLALAARQGGGLGVMLADIDDFKNINDSLGHAAGDEVLQIVARRMREALRDTDVVARYSGDEFVIVVCGVTDAQQLAAIAAKLLEAAGPVISVEKTDIFATLSIGIAHYPTDGADAATLLQHADAAMYRVKENGRNGFRFYATEMNATALEKLRMSSSLRHGLKRNEFLLHYQPKAEAGSGRIVGFEALVRWQHPEHGMLPPGRFIPHAESSGAIEPLGEWVLRAALAQARAWRDAGSFSGTMAVNLSMRQLYNPDLPKLVHKALGDHGIEPAWLELEVTESMVSHNPDMAARALRELHRTGVSIAIDDFGTGQSSLAYLMKFPFSTLKIDRSFSTDVPLCADTCSIVRAIIALARSLRMRLVAEGVESTGQRTFFEMEGCDEIQGYLVGKPMPAHEATRFLESLVRRPAVDEGMGACAV